jgi:hypothetical protein
MSSTQVLSPTSRLRFGLARVDITPPVGIYHPLWGAARHHRSTGVHRPLTAEVMAFGPAGETAPRLIRAQLDSPGLVKSQHEALLKSLSEASGLPEHQIVISYSHTHAAGWFTPDRFKMPGGDLIPPYLESGGAKLQTACRQALAGYQEVLITYAAGRCNLAANRDYWDEANGNYACGFNPDAPADDTLIAARITTGSGRLVGVVVNYACHPTTLAWENTLISPDYVGSLREEVERATGALCVFAQGACGDLGPREGFVGDTAVADRNGRQVAYAALSALASLGPPATDFMYRGPIISGATLGTWGPSPFNDKRLTEVSHFAGGVYTVALPLKPRPDREALQQELDGWLARIQEADARGDSLEARNATGRAERARRWLARLNDLPAGESIPLHYSVYRLGDAVWVACGGEPYNLIQVELRRRFPELTLIFSPMSGDLQAAYLLPQDRYGKGLYQEEPSILAAGCLEMLTEAITGRVEEL